MGDQKIKYVYCDGGPELVAAAKQINARCDTATPYNPKKNSIAEEKAKRVLYASRTLLEQSGLDPWFWPYSVKAASVGLNVVGGQHSPYSRRRGVDFNGKFIPFGCIIDYLPLSRDAGTSTPVFGPRAIPGIFLGYHINSGGVWGHSHKQGDYYVADFSQMQLKPTRQKPSRYRVSNIVFEKNNISFPLKEDHIRRTRTMNIDNQDITLIRGQDFPRGDSTSDPNGTLDVKSHVDEPKDSEPERKEEYYGSEQMR